MEISEERNREIGHDSRGDNLGKENCEGVVFVTVRKTVFPREEDFSGVDVVSEEGDEEETSSSDQEEDEDDAESSGSESGEDEPPAPPAASEQEHEELGKVPTHRTNLSFGFVHAPADVFKLFCRDHFRRNKKLMKFVQIESQSIAFLLGLLISVN